MKKIVVIGAGIAGLSSAACLARAGLDVTILEKNRSPGGRARKFESGGFVFDMGPSWYWMPDVFDRFFGRFEKTVSDYYTLTRLDPSYRVYYGQDDWADVPAGIPRLCDFFEHYETGSSKQLLRFLEEGSYKYDLGIGNLVYKPGRSWREFLDSRLLSGMFRFHIFQTFSQYVRKFFKNPRLISLLEFPVLFLGAPPAKTPALYSLMNYADMSLGTWYPMGGMNKIIEGMVKLCHDLGVKFFYNAEVTRIQVQGRIATGACTGGKFHPADFVVAGADYRHVEKDLLPKESQEYSEKYWDTRVMAPSCLIYYLGLNKRVKNLMHHTLFFDKDIGLHISQIYKHPRWPTAPQFYVCCPSKTDTGVAPPGYENLFVLIPVAPALKDTESIREKYFTMVMDRMEKLTGEDLRAHIVFRKSYAHNDFLRDYNAFKGNAYGLANILLQTANLKPAVESKKVRNVFYTGHMTVPGPGVPPALISGQVTAAAVFEKLWQKNERKNAL
jgi:phytoene desaturase